MSFDPRITAARGDLADERLREAVDATRYSHGVMKRVVAPSAPLRSRPSPEASIDTEALMGEAVRVFDEEEGLSWGQLESDGYVGYMPSDALGGIGPDPIHRVSALRTFIYPGPDLKLPPLAHLSLGAAVAVAAEHGDYRRLATGGYVFSGHLAPVGRFEDDFVAVAERLVGTPYLWGGKTSLGLDCSGLIQLSLASAGLKAPRDSDMQEKALGEHIATKPDLCGLRRGDLIFWNGHVGVMTDGEHLLHANGYHMATVIEPLRVAQERIRVKSFGPIVSIKRLPGRDAA